MVDWSTAADHEAETDSAGDVHAVVPYTDLSDDDRIERGYAYEKHPISVGLALWLPLAWSGAHDLSGNDNHGTLNTPTTGVAGRAGLDAMAFTASESDNIDCPLPSASAPFTFSAWVRPGSQSAFRMVAHLANGSTDQFAFGINSDETVRVADGDTQLVNSTSALTVGEWSHIVGIIDPTGGTHYIYINGSQDASSTTTYSPPSNSLSGVFVGENVDSNVNQPYDGDIADVRLYNRALTAGEIQALYDLYSADVATPPTDGVARYALDGDATDSWGSNDGTNNGVTFVSDAIRGQSGDFQRSNNDYIDTFNFTATTWTVSFWFKLDSLSSALGDNQRLVSNIEFTNYTGFGVFAWKTDDTIRLDIANGSSGGTSRVSTTTVPSTGEWYHYTATYDGSAVTVYLNGNVENTLSAGYAAANENTQLGRGIHSGGVEYLGGHLDDVRLYNYALEPYEVFENYLWGTFGVDASKHTVRV